MKTLIFLIALVLSQPAFCRQYFQCRVVDYDSTDVMVINLATTNNGTLFLSSGMQNPEDERVLVNIEFDRVENFQHIFNVADERGEGTVSIPAEAIGRSASRVLIDLSFTGYSFSYVCFTQIYND